MSDYLIHDSTLEDIADAIRSKTGGSSLINPEDMPTEIASISGGGSLPSSISKIDGGTFTFASNTSTTNAPISHNLGEAPKCFVIWADDLDLSTAGNNAVIRGAFIRDASQSTTGSYLYQMNVYNGNMNPYTRNIGNNYSDYANESTISFNVGNNYYVATNTYNWLAWA